MYSQSQITETVERFRQSFWRKTHMDHPPVGVVCDGTLLPVNYMRSGFSGSELFPGDIHKNLFSTDYDYTSVHRGVFTDNWVPFNSAWRAVPWIEAICGCPVRYASGSLAPGHCVDSIDDLREYILPANKTWLKILERQTKELVASAPADCWISPSILRGPSDILAAMRGMTDFYMDLYDNIQVIDEMAGRINKLFINILDRHFSVVRPNLGGYGHIYGYWAPGKTITIQEDALGMCSPDVYRDVFMKYNADIVNHLGLYVLFHLHSTGYGHYRDVLEIPGLAGLEMTIEENGPPLHEMVPFLRETLERSRLILFVHHYFEDVPHVLKQIPHEGLFLIISDKFIKSENEFRAFKEKNW
ncbi:MAG: hypothetical protein JXB48_19400 [Candidatus Latescibacteria bacterium]|nr:hypothetical protein [Candidatus Latescibacterota bacterium]